MEDDHSSGDSTSDSQSLPTDGGESSEEEADPFTRLEIHQSFYQPLYVGASLTILESYLKLIQFSLRHSLTKHAFI